MKVLVSKIKIDEKNRLRATGQGDVVDLALSMKEIGQIQPVVINEYYKLIAGERRLQAAKDLEWTHIDATQVKGLNPLQELDIELHENWRRKNFTEYEIGQALLKREELYKLVYPETTPEHKHELQARDSDGHFSEKLPSGQISAHTAVTTEVAPTVETKNSGANKEPKKAFAKSAAEVLGVSETTIKTKLQVAKAVKAKELSEEEVKEFKEGTRSFSAVLGRIREKGKQEATRKKSFADIRAEQKKLGLESALKAMEDEGINDIVDAVNGVREKENITPVILCVDCKKSLPVNCPSCDHKYLLCDRDWFEHELDEEACKRYDR